MFVCPDQFFNKLYLLNLLFVSLEGIKEYFLIYFYECVLPVCMYCMYVCMYATRMSGTHGGQKRELDHPEREIG